MTTPNREQTMTNNRVNHITGKPDYINKELKKVSKEELLSAIREVHEKNERDHAQMMADTAQALHGGNFVCMPRRVQKEYNRAKADE